LDTGTPSLIFAGKARVCLYLTLKYYTKGPVYKNFKALI
jgi:hypothetical protein